MVWKAIQSYSSRIEAPAIMPLKRFDNRLQGKEPDAVEDRWRTCVKACDSDLGWILSKFFVDRYVHAPRLRKTPLIRNIVHSRRQQRNSEIKLSLISRTALTQSSKMLNG